MKTAIFLLTFICTSLCAWGAEDAEDKKQAIVHLSDRYVLYPEAMQLSGQETLMDIFMSLPDIFTVDATELVSLDNNGKGIADQFGQYVLRIDNVDANLDIETFLRTQRVSDFEKIQIVAHPGVQKGCAGQKQVIDLTYCAPEKKNSVKTDVEATTYGKATLGAMDVFHAGRHTLRSYLYGNHNHRTYDGGKNTHELKEDAKLQYTFDLTPQDRFLIVGTQNFSQLSTTGVMKDDFKRQYTIEGDYNHDFDFGAYVLGLLNAQYQHDNVGADRNRNLYSTIVIEGGLPFLHKMMDLLVGTEIDYSRETDNVKLLTDRQLSADLYYQLSLHLKKFNISAGGRSRFSNFWMHNNVATNQLQKFLYNDHWHLSMWYNFNSHHTLQALATRRFYDPGFGDMRRYLIDNEPDAIRQHGIYTGEVRYTYQKKGFYVMGLLKDVNISDYYSTNVGSYNENILQTGASALWRRGIFSLSGGVTYNWAYCPSEIGYIYNNHFVVVKFNPQLHTRSGWNFSSKLIYSSRNEYTYESFTPGNVYVDADISKNIGRHWTARLGMRDIASQHFGNRAVTFGAKYYY